jgi:hypothetical protein
MSVLSLQLPNGIDALFLIVIQEIVLNACKMHDLSVF